MINIAIGMCMMILVGTAKPIPTEEPKQTVIEVNYTETYTEPVYQEPTGTGCLTKQGGVFWYGSQKETYYNLDMSVVVSVAQSNGIAGEYWIREDGCKMLGDYIMIAANYNIHPYGSLVSTSLGTGIVVDTGGFASYEPYGVDIAVDW